MQFHIFLVFVSLFSFTFIICVNVVSNYINLPFMLINLCRRRGDPTSRKGEGALAAGNITIEYQHTEAAGMG